MKSLREGRLFSSLLFVLLSTMAAFSLEAANWTTPTDLSPAGANTAGAQVFVDSSKRAIAVWSGFDGSNYVIQSATRDEKGVWSMPTTISAAGGDAFYPQVVVDSHGNATAIWSRKTGAAFIIQSASKQCNEKWSKPVSISKVGNAERDALYPQIVLDGNGTAYVVWQKNNGTRNVIRFSAQDPNGKWSAPATLSAKGSPGIGDTRPQIAINAAGDLMVVWCNAAQSAVQWVSQLGHNAWTQPMNISLPGTNVSDAQIGMDKNGNAVALWTGSDGVNRVVQTAKKPVDGAWSAPVNLSAPGQDATAPSFAMNSDGFAVAAWQRFDGANSIVEATMLPVNGAWKPVVGLTVTGEDATSPQVGVGSTPVAVVVWKRSDGSNFVIQSSKTTLGQEWAAPFTISVTGEDAVAPQLSINQLGNAVTVFERSNGTNTVVQASSKSFLE